jgi:hypothetical protein
VKSSLANMVANPPESRIPLNSCYLVLAVLASAESAERSIFCQDTSFAPGDHMLSSKLLVSFGVDMFASEIGHQQPKSVRSAAKSARITSLCPSP